MFRRPHSDLPEAVRQVAKHETAICGVVLQEVLQGIQPESHVSEIRRSLLCHYYLEATQRVYVQAVHFARWCRKEGISFPTVDALIASIAVHHGAHLWALDRDFIRAAQVIPLQLYRQS